MRDWTPWFFNWIWTYNPLKESKTWQTFKECHSVIGSTGSTFSFVICATRVHIKLACQGSGWIVFGLNIIVEWNFVLNGLILLWGIQWFTTFILIILKFISPLQTFVKQSDYKISNIVYEKAKLFGVEVVAEVRCMWCIHNWYCVNHYFKFYVSRYEFWQIIISVIYGQFTALRYVGVHISLYFNFSSINISQSMKRRHHEFSHVPFVK